MNNPKAGKKILPLILLALFLLLISGCSNQKSSATTTSVEKNQTTIVTSFYPMYIATKNVARDITGVTVIDMTKPQTGCLHDYQLTPEDLKTLEKANFFVINGAGMEAFMDKVTKQRPNLQVINASQGIPLMKNQNTTDDNPHIWVSVTAAIKQVQNISDQLSQLDPKHATQYKKNAQAYTQKLTALKEKMHTAIDPLPNRNIITFHEAFPYFAQEFHLNIVGVIEREPGSEPSAAELARTIKMIQKLKVKAIFAEPQYSAKAATTIANETGSKVYKLDPAVTGPDNYDAYITIMENNLQTLEGALK